MGLRVSTPPVGASHSAMGGGRVERCCSWTQTVQGFIDREGRPDSGRRCLGEEGPGLRWHCTRWRSPLSERR